MMDGLPREAVSLYAVSPRLLPFPRPRRACRLSLPPLFLTQDRWSAVVRAPCRAFRIYPWLRPGVRWWARGQTRSLSPAQGRRDARRGGGDSRESRRLVLQSASEPARFIQSVRDGVRVVCDLDADRRGLLSKEDRYGFKLAMGYGSGHSPRIFHHPIHQGRPVDVVLCALGVSQGRWLDHLAGVPQGQDSAPGTPVPSSPRHRAPGCALDRPRRAPALRRQETSGTATPSPLSPLDPVSPTPVGLLFFGRLWSPNIGQNRCLSARLRP